MRKDSKNWRKNWHHGFWVAAFVLLVLGAAISLGLIYWLLYNIRL